MSEKIITFLRGKNRGFWIIILLLFTSIILFWDMMFRYASDQSVGILYFQIEITLAFIAAIFGGIILVIIVSESISDTK